MITINGLPQPPAVILLHFNTPVGHAGHYLGFAGAELPGLVRVALTRGDVRLAATWRCANAGEARVVWERERAKGGRSRICPICKAERQGATHG